MRRPSARRIKRLKPQSPVKPLDSRIAWLFKPYFVRRPGGNCQVLFALTELDGLVARIIKEVDSEGQGWDSR